MPTKRARVTRNRHEEFSNTLLYTATDGAWGDPNELNDSEKYLDLRFTSQRQEVWFAIRDELLPEWIRERPGTRPSWWYECDRDCPRISAEDIARRGWEGWFFVKRLPDLRRRLGGVGDPMFEHLALVPQLYRAMPIHFVRQSDVDEFSEEGEDFTGKPIDPKNPPIYESEAAYLRRHGLLTADEKRRLKRSDFKPISITTTEWWS
jgi:hypothetical protein